MVLAEGEQLEGEVGYAEEEVLEGEELDPAYGEGEEVSDFSSFLKGGRGDYSEGGPPIVRGGLPMVVTGGGDARTEDGLVCAARIGDK